MTKKKERALLERGNTHATKSSSRLCLFTVSPTKQDALLIWSRHQWESLRCLSWPARNSHCTVFLFDFIIQTNPRATSWSACTVTIPEATVSQEGIKNATSGALSLPAKAGNQASDRHVDSSLHFRKLNNLILWLKSGKANSLASTKRWGWGCERCTSVRSEQHNLKLTGNIHIANVYSGQTNQKFPMRWWGCGGGHQIICWCKRDAGLSHENQYADGLEFHTAYKSKLKVACHSGPTEACTVNLLNWAFICVLWW